MYFQKIIVYKIPPGGGGGGGSIASSRPNLRFASGTMVARSNGVSLAGRGWPGIECWLRSR